MKKSMRIADSLATLLVVMVGSANARSTVASTGSLHAGVTFETDVPCTAATAWVWSGHRID
jgi:hypothetical protein